MKNKKITPPPHFLKASVNQVFRRNAILLACMMLLVTNVFSQTFQKAVWSLPGDYVKFTASGPGTPIALPIADYTGNSTYQAHNAMHDANGNLLFFIVDNGAAATIDGTYTYNTYSVFDGGGKLIGNLTYNNVYAYGGSENRLTASDKLVIIK